jgi:hypothetical protein
MDEEFDGVDIKLLEVILEVAYDHYMNGETSVGNTFSDVRRFSSQFGIDVLQAALREGLRLRVFKRIDREPGNVKLTDRMWDAFSQFEATLLDDIEPDLFFMVYGIDRNAEDNNAF